MTCCTGQCVAASFYDSRVAKRDLRRYLRRGPDASTRMLLSELRQWPLQGLHLLDVGAGIGVIGMELTGAGIASVTLADASPAYLEVARRHLGIAKHSCGSSTSIAALTHRQPRQALPKNYWFWAGWTLSISRERARTYVHGDGGVFGQAVIRQVLEVGPPA